jgi:hypothetical protein
MRRSGLVLVVIAGWSTPALAQVAVERTRFELPSSNGHGAIVVHLDDADPGRARRVTHFREHLFAVEEPVLDENGDEVWNGTDFAAVYTRDLLYDAYFGLRSGGDQRWLPDAAADLDASGYVGWNASARGGTGVVQLVQQVGELEATTYLFAPQALDQAAFVMVLRVHNGGTATASDVQAFSLHNVHLGFGRATSPFGVPDDIAENGETLERVVDADGEAFVERGFAGVVAARAVGDVVHFGTAPGGNPFAIVDGGGAADLADNDPSPTGVTGAVGAWQFDLGDLAADEQAWVAIVVAHEGDPFAGPGTLAIVDDWIDGRNAQQIVDDEVALWADFQDTLAIPEGTDATEERLLRHGATMLRMGQVREGETYLREWLTQDGEIRRTRFDGTLPGVVEHRGAGAVLASLPPGNWTYAWIRDGAYAVKAMAQLGMQAEARDALAFYLDAEAGRFQDWNELARYDMPPYQISLVRYYGFGVEETDFNAFGPNLEFDGLGLFLWALRAYERATGDETLGDEHWALVSEQVADVLVALVEPSTGLLRPDSSIWETHWNGRERHWAYTNITAVRGLCDAAEIAERNGDDARAQTYRDTAESMRDAIATRLTDDDGFIASNLEELEAGGGYYDAAVLDAIAMGLFDPQGEIATSTLAGLDAELLVEASGVGWARNDDRTDHEGGEDVSPWGSDYDSAEWVITDLRGAIATRLAGDDARSAALLEWVRAQADANYLMVAETYEEVTGQYKFNTPMLGFGAGAYTLALAARAGDVDEPACGQYWEGGGDTDSSGSGGSGGSESGGASTGTSPTSSTSASTTGPDPITISETLEGSSDTDPGALCPEGSSDCPSSCACTTSPRSSPAWWLVLVPALRRRRRSLTAASTR